MRCFAEGAGKVSEFVIRGLFQIPFSATGWMSDSADFFRPILEYDMATFARSQRLSVSAGVQAGRYAEAERQFRRALSRASSNGWSDTRDWRNYIRHVAKPQRPARSRLTLPEPGLATAGFCRFQISKARASISWPGPSELVAEFLATARALPIRDYSWPMRRNRRDGCVWTRAQARSCRCR